MKRKKLDETEGSLSERTVVDRQQIQQEDLDEDSLLTPKDFGSQAAQWLGDIAREDGNPVELDEVNSPFNIPFTDLFNLHSGLQYDRDLFDAGQYLKEEKQFFEALGEDFGAEYIEDQAIEQAIGVGRYFVLEEEDVGRAVHN